MPPTRYRADIEGLRALAVLSVVLFHYFPQWMPGGMIGVDIFFVISGYLITQIIVSGIEKGNFSFGTFYARRIRRIFPALLLIIATCLVAGWYLLLPDEFGQLGKHTAAAGVFAANFAFWNEAGYFDTDSAKKVLLHLWSLGVEEQFYLAWPLIIWSMARRSRSFLAPAVVLTVGSFAINMVAVHHYPFADFYSPITRFWEIGAGAVLANLSPARTSHVLRSFHLLSALGFCLLAAGLFLIDKNSAFPGAWALLPVAGAFCIIASGAEAFPNRLILINGPATFIGRISYPLYLWHWPLLAFGYVVVHSDIPTRGARIVLLLCSAALACLTYQFLEKKIRFRKDARTLALLCGCSTALTLLGLLIWTSVLPPRQNDKSLDPIMRAIMDDRFPPPGFVAANIDGVPVLQKGNSPHKTLFVGDSHMQQYAVRLSADLDTDPTLNAAIFLTHHDCPPVATPRSGTDCAPMQAALRKLVLRDDIDTVVFAGSWKSYVGGNGEKFRFAMTQMLRPLAIRKRVYVVLDNPQGPAFDPKNFIEGSRFGTLRYRSAMRTVPREAAELAVQALVIQSARDANAAVLDPTENLCHGNFCAVVTAEGTPIYRDTGHLRPGYVTRNAGFLDVTLRRPH